MPVPAPVTMATLGDELMMVAGLGLGKPCAATLHVPAYSASADSQQYSVKAPWRASRSRRLPRRERGVESAVNRRT